MTNDESKSNSRPPSDKDLPLYSIRRKEIVSSVAVPVLITVVGLVIAFMRNIYSDQTSAVEALRNEFKNEIQQNYNIKLVDGVAKAIDKENEYKVFDLKDLVSKNDEILELSKGRQQSGINHRQGETVKIEGVPFDVPKDADSKTRTKLIQEHLAKEGISTMHKDYSAKFAELNQKILTQKTV